MNNCSPSSQHGLTFKQLSKTLPLLIAIVMLYLKPDLNLKNQLFTPYLSQLSKISFINKLNNIRDSGQPRLIYIYTYLQVFNINNKL